MTDTRVPVLVDDPTSGTLLAASLQAYAEAAAAFARASRAPATEAAYNKDFRHFEAWCSAHNLVALPTTPSILALFLSAHADTFSVATLQRRVAAIMVAHRRAGIESASLRHDPRFADVWAGIRRTKGTASKGKAPLITDDVRRLVAHLPDTLAGKRDRSIILVGFAAALRRSEIVGLDVADLSLSSQGLQLHIRKSKRDQEGQGMIKAIPYGQNPETCPVRATKDWLLASRFRDGPVYRAIDRFGRIGQDRLSAQVVRLIVRAAIVRAAQAEGCTRQEAERQAGAYAAHSLRSGWVTSAAAAGIPDLAVMAHTGHRHRDTAQKYLEIGRLWADHPAGRVGL